MGICAGCLGEGLVSVSMSTLSDFGVYTLDLSFTADSLSKVQKLLILLFQQFNLRKTFLLIAGKLEIGTCTEGGAATFKRKIQLRVVT